MTPPSSLWAFLGWLGPFSLKMLPTGPVHLGAASQGTEGMLRPRGADLFPGLGQNSSHLSEPQGSVFQTRLSPTGVISGVSFLGLCSPHQMLPPKVLKVQHHHLPATSLFFLPLLSTWAMPEITLDGGGGGEVQSSLLSRHIACRGHGSASVISGDAIGRRVHVTTANARHRLTLYLLVF